MQKSRLRKIKKILLERYNVNIDRSINRLSQAENAIGSSVQVLQRIHELSIQARNDTYNAGDRAAIAMEIKNLREQMLSLANSRDANGQYIFAGYKVETQPFVEDLMAWYNTLEIGCPHIANFG